MLFSLSVLSVCVCMRPVHNSYYESIWQNTTSKSFPRAYDLSNLGSWPDNGVNKGFHLVQLDLNSSQKLLANLMMFVQLLCSSGHALAVPSLL